MKYVYYIKYDMLSRIHLSMNVNVIYKQRQKLSLKAVISPIK